MNVLEARGVRVELGGHAVLEHVDLAVGAGEVVLLAGRNGSGKSTLLEVLAGVRRRASGDVLLAGRELVRTPARERARQVTLIPQDVDSPFEFTGRELVMMGRHPHIARFGQAGPHDHDAVEQALQKVDATGFADRPVTTLSGGERRRIGIARALATGADVVLADEPTANLDLDRALAILGVFRSMAEAGGTVLLVSHDLNATAPLVDRVALLHAGRIHCTGAPDTALCDANIELVFGVRAAPPSGAFPRRFVPL